jgi:hypothetical protein
MSQPTPRPPLNMGAMGGTRDEIVERMDDLVATFNVLMGTELDLVDDPSGGATDCKTVIRVPFDDPEAYLICEHELSHPFAETDLELTEMFREKAVERLLTRAGIPITSPDAIPYKKKLAMLVHHLWNVLEDWRCCSVWGEVYYGGATLLRQRWESVAQYDMAKDSEEDLAAYLGRLAAGFDTPTAPPEFRKCAPHMISARAQVELVDNKACLAITARLVDDIADELLGFYPPDPKKNSPQSQAQAKLHALAQTLSVGTPPSAQNSDPGKLGAKDLQPDPTKGTKGSKRRVSAKAMGQMRKLMTASNKDGDPAANKKSSLQSLLDDGTEKMQQRISAAKSKLGQQTKSQKNQQEEVLVNAGRVCGIDTKYVSPVVSLPKPSRKAGGMRRYLEQIHLEQTSIPAFTGTKIHVPTFVQARLSGNLSSYPVFQRTEESGGLQLLILADVSGSMVGHGLDMLEQALADVEFSCKALPVDLHLWAFSSSLYLFKKFGSPRNAPGLQMQYTSMVQALDVAVEWSKAGKTDRGVILITDGLPTSCRHRKSSGNPSKDLQDVMKELRGDKVILSVLAIGSRTDQYDSVFGEKKYGLVKSLADVPGALADATRIIVEVHLKK